ncbi:MAG: hypothetical protein IPK16_18695 [Anaerolineales bacterium]|nr:hypothetical protein [Anaerolineales bacterium]
MPTVTACVTNAGQQLGQRSGAVKMANGVVSRLGSGRRRCAVQGFDRMPMAHLSMPTATACDNVGTQIPLRDGTGSQNRTGNGQRGGMGGRP